MQPVNVGYCPYHYGQHNHDTCRAGTSCDTVRRYDSSYCSDEDQGIAHSPCAKCTPSLAYTPAATLSDIKKNAETLERDRTSILTSDCHRHSGYSVEHHGGGSDESTFHNCNGAHHQGNRFHCSNSHAAYSAYPMRYSHFCVFMGNASANHNQFSQDPHFCREKWMLSRPWHCVPEVDGHAKLHAFKPSQ